MFSELRTYKLIPRVQGACQLFGEKRPNFKQEL